MQQNERSPCNSPVQSSGEDQVTGAEEQLEKLRCLIQRIYKDHSAEELDSMWSQLLQILEENSAQEIDFQTNSCSCLDSSTAVLITYADTVFTFNEPTLKTLKYLIDNYLGNLASVIHVLPFLCSTSDGGFAVSSYEKIEDRFGTWEDLKNLSSDHVIMADLVLNHVSSSHPWVQQFKNGIEPGKKYILNPSITDNWENVIRPRNTSLFTSIYTKDGHKNVWTTFGSDQVDLNWKEPSIFLEFLKLIVKYIKHGVGWIRLDAIGFIWKKPSTTCLHMEEVHHVVKALRILLKNIHSSSILLTETNVPEKENISYINPGDEAHLAYNFPLPPLLLESLISNKADLINKWLSSWPDLPIKTGFLNFTASHDGIGLRALEGLMEPSRIHKLLVECETRGGLVSHRRMPNGEDQPYELNISWWSAMSNSGTNRQYLQFEKYILSQLFIIALKGVPAFYLPTIMTSENDTSRFLKTGERRDLNREKFDKEQLIELLNDKNSLASRSLILLRHAMKTRGLYEAFDPEQPMNCYSKDHNDIVVISRGIDEDKIFAIHNMTNLRLSFCIEDNLGIKLKPQFVWKDLLNSRIYNNNTIELKPYWVCWLKKTNAS